MQEVTLSLEQKHTWSCGQEDRSTTEKTIGTRKEIEWSCLDGGDSCNEDGAKQIDGG